MPLLIYMYMYVYAFVHMDVTNVCRHVEIWVRREIYYYTLFDSC